MNTSSGPRHLGKYELRKLLGRGGMAEVWKAFDTHLQRYVAIKLLHADLQNDPHFVARFEREARVVAGLHHRNIVQIHDFQVSRFTYSQGLVAYMVMDYIEGPTLADYIARTSEIKKYPPVSDIVNLFAALSSAIDYAHQHGVIHRDIKPANVLLDLGNRSRTPIGEPMLTDFGIAKLMGSSTGFASGSWVGTELYLSPEQAQGYVGNERSDFYALGVILYEICTGTRPFQGDSPASVAMQHIKMMPTLPALLNPNIPPALTEVIMRGLAKDPTARFTSASAMTTALAEALNMPVPEDLRQFTSVPEAMNEPTYYIPRQLDVSQAAMPTTPSSPMSTSSSPLAFPAARLATPPPQASVSSEHSTPPITPGATPIGNSAGGISLENRGQNVASQTPMPPPILVPSSASRPGRRRNNRLVVAIAVLLLLLLISGLGVYSWLSHSETVPPVTAIPIVGHAFFVSSGQLQEGNSRGINDELQINLQNIPAPSPGKSYYAWLLGDKICDPDSTNPSLVCDPKDPKHQRILNPIAPILLGRLSVIAGSVHFHYPGDQQHTDLIGIASRLLITEEDANKTPESPSTDQSSWRYYAELPQIPNPYGRHHTAFHTLRNLLYEGEALGPRGLHGGAEIRLLRNTEKVLEWASSARDAWGIDPGLIHRQVIRILDYLDGTTLVKEDVPPNTPLLVDATLAYVPLIDLHQIEKVRSYLHNMDVNLTALPRQQGVTPEVGQLATQANEALQHNVANFFEQVHKDAKLLIKMSDAQLRLPATLSILNDMQKWANYALIGRLDPSTDTLQDGVLQIHYIFQRLATFDLKPYKAG